MWGFKNHTNYLSSIQERHGMLKGFLQRSSFDVLIISGTI